MDDVYKCCNVKAKGCLQKYNWTQILMEASESPKSLKYRYDACNNSECQNVNNFAKIKFDEYDSLSEPDRPNNGGKRGRSK